MPSKQKPAEKSVDNGVQFINYTLTEKEKAGFKKALAEGDWDKFYEAVDTLLADGYTLSVKWDEFNKCYSAFVTAKKPDSPNAGCILTGRGRTAVAAIFGAMYRHTAVFSGVWPMEAINRVGTDDD